MAHRDHEGRPWLHRMAWLGIAVAVGVALLLAAIGAAVWFVVWSFERVGR